MPSRGPPRPHPAASLLYTGARPGFGPARAGNDTSRVTGKSPFSISPDRRAAGSVVAPLGWHLRAGGGLQALYFFFVNRQDGCGGDEIERVPSRRAGSPDLAGPLRAEARRHPAAHAAGFLKMDGQSPPRRLWRNELDMQAIRPLPRPRSRQPSRIAQGTIFADGRRPLARMRVGISFSRS